MLKKLNSLVELDKKLFLLINSWHSGFFDKIMPIVSGQIIWFPFFILIVWLFFKQYNKQGFNLLIFLILAIGISDFTSVHLFKNVFERLRPCHNPDFKNVIHLINGHCGGLYGFVSSHSANFFAIFSFSSLIIKKKYFTLLSLSVAVLVAYSRIYLGVHYPADVAVGGLLGIFNGFWAYRLFIFLSEKNFLLNFEKNKDNVNN